MDLSATTDVLNRWLDREYEFNVANSDPANSDDLDARVEEELLSLVLKRKEWGGELPYSRMRVDFEPSIATMDDEDSLERLARRTLFKVELWSAPDLGGVVRCLVGPLAKQGSIAQTAYVLDLAELDGKIRLMGVNVLCHECGATGLLEGGDECLATFDETPCARGLFPRGGLALEPGELLASERFAAPGFEMWNRYMER